MLNYIIIFLFTLGLCIRGLLYLYSTKLFNKTILRKLFSYSKSSCLDDYYKENKVAGICYLFFGVVITLFTIVLILTYPQLLLSNISIFIIIMLVVDILISKLIYVKVKIDKYDETHNKKGSEN